MELHKKALEVNRDLTRAEVDGICLQMRASSLREIAETFLQPAPPSPTVVMAKLDNSEVF